MTYNFVVGASTVYNPNAVIITGGSMNNVPVGATTPATGAFTTLAAQTPITGNSSTAVATTAFVQNLTSGIVALTSTGGSQTLTNVQYGCGILSLTGTLASNCTLVLPTSGVWVVRNGTTGAFTVTCKTAAGTGVLISQGTSDQIYADGTNINYVADANASLVMEWTGGTIVANGTYPYALYMPYAGTIQTADYLTAAATSFVFAVQIAGTNVTGLSAVTASSATLASTNATAANVFATGQRVDLIVSSATGSPTNAVVSLRIVKS